jgi:ligand-binding sensor domain-containing protein
LYSLRKFLFILLLVSATNLVFAQNPVSTLISNQNGLPSNTVYSMLQDSKGFIWLGHDKGLSRYDGNSFKHYIATGQQGKSLSNLLEHKGEIYCQDFSGNFYFTKNQTLEKLSAFKSTGAYAPAGIINNEIISSINYDSIKSYNIKSAAKFKEASVQKTLQAVYHSKNASYFLRNNQLQQFNGNSISIEQTFKEELQGFGFLAQINNSFYAFNRFKYPICYKLENNKQVPLNNFKQDLLIQNVNIIEDEVWINTTTGAYCFDKFMQPMFSGKCFFSESSISNVIKDREGNYWFATLNKGVLVVPDINSVLHKYGSEGITSLSTYQGNEVLAGTSSNLIFSFNGKTNVFNTIVSNETKGEIFSVFYDKKYNSVISCANEMAFYKNGQNTDRIGLAGKSIAIISDNIYAASFSGGTLVLPRNKSSTISPVWVKKYIETADNELFLTKGARGRAVVFDSIKQILYAATSEGLYFFSANEKATIQINNKPIYASSLSIVNGVLYAGTFTDGILAIENNKARSINSENSKVAKSIHRLFSNDGNLWIAGDDKIQMLRTSNGKLTEFSVGDGLPKAEIKDIVVQNNLVYVGTTDGLVVFSAEKNPLNNVAAALRINKFLVNGQEQDLSKKNSFAANENNIEISFSLLTFKDNSSASISYKIDNGNWQQLPNGVRSIQLAALAGGTHTIEVKAVNEDAVAAEKNITLEFSIATPFYKNIWFFALLGAIVIGAIYFYFKQKLGNQTKQNNLLAQKIELEQELHQSMLSSIKSQMNPHFLFNALNTVQSYIYTNEKENASLYLGKFSELTRTILDMSNKPKVSLSEELRALQLYMELEQLRFEDKLTWNLQVQQSISTETVSIPSMLIQPYIENAIKHGLMHSKQKWNLQINFTQQQNAIVVSIDDNGVGRAASEAINKQRSKSHTSFATGANQKRLDILNKGLGQSISLQTIDKVDEHGAAAGTTVILNIPIL